MTTDQLVDEIEDGDRHSHAPTLLAITALGFLACSLMAAVWPTFRGDWGVLVVVHKLPGLSTISEWMELSVARPWVYVFIVTTLAIRLVTWRRPIWALGFLASVAGGPLLVGLFLPLVSRGRPLDPTLLTSYPSTLVTYHTVLFGFAALIAWRRAESIRVRNTVVAFCGLIVVMAGVSRMHFQAHWPSDVVGSWLGASAWVLLIDRLIVMVEQEDETTTNEDSEDDEDEDFNPLEEPSFA